MKKTTLFLVATIFGLLISYRGITNSTGAPNARNGSPSSFGTCAAAGCHVGPAVTTESISISTDIPAAGFEENTDYTITVTADDGGRNLSVMGFQASVESAGGAEGNIISTSNATQKFTGSSFITHTFSGTGASGGSRSWNFTWNSGTAPDQSTVYVAVNFTNSNGASTGDVILTEELVLTRDQTVGVAEYEASPSLFYPNPAGDYLQIPQPELWPEGLLIYNLRGQLIKRIPADEISDRIAIDDLNDGHYLIGNPGGKSASHLRIDRQ